ncbi:MAG: hypothetical protein ACI89X_001958, partial [Planctomycetota bacterium]
MAADLPLKLLLMALVHESPGRSRRLPTWGFPTTYRAMP